MGSTLKKHNKSLENEKIDAHSGGTGTCNTLGGQAIRKRQHWIS